MGSADKRRSVSSLEPTTVVPSGPAAAPFPWHSLDSMTRAEATALRAVLRWAAHHVRLDAAEASLGAILGTPVSVRSRRVRVAAGGDPAESAVSVELRAEDDASGTPPRLLLEIEAALAAAVAARVTRRPVPIVVTADEEIGAPVAGAVAAVAAAALRRAHTGAPLRVRAAGSPAAWGGPSLAPAARCGVFDLTVLVGDDAFVARVLAPLERVPVPAAGSFDRERLRSLGSLPLSLPIVACATLSSVAELGALRAGDVFFPGVWKLVRSERGLTGPVHVAPSSCEVGLRADLGDDGRLVLGRELQPIVGGQDAEASMTDSRESQLLTAMGEIPVVVRVEIGEASMPARDWASLGRGDVVALGRRVGERVVLRVGGLVVASGELVEVDGEVGVRIVERLNAEPSAS